MSYENDEDPGPLFRRPRRVLPDIDGSTYDPALDGIRLGDQARAVYDFMRDGRWHTLDGIASFVGSSATGVSARLRDLRKPRFGGFRVESRRTPGAGRTGSWEYRVLPPARLNAPRSHDTV